MAQGLKTLLLFVCFPKLKLLFGMPTLHDWLKGLRLIELKIILGNTIYTLRVRYPAGKQQLTGDKWMNVIDSSFCPLVVIKCYNAVLLWGDLISTWGLTHTHTLSFPWVFVINIYVFWWQSWNKSGQTMSNTLVLQHCGVWLNVSVQYFTFLLMPYFAVASFGPSVLTSSFKRNNLLSSVKSSLSPVLFVCVSMEMYFLRLLHQWLWL